MTEQIDYPLLEVEETANAIIARGGFIYQKWTCAGCKKRVTGNMRNMLTIKGHCGDCGTITDILESGCNYIAAIPRKPA